ncbi:MAG: polysaccharide deacetylase family protein [Pyrinomonadaceae bacterium]|nr:polysaccharide deacetylase family protein [Pyrinomonadaceae bacterium]
MKKQILQSIYSLGGFRPFHFLKRNELLILTYHRFSEEPSPTTVSREELQEHLSYLKKNTNVVSLDDAVQMISEESDLPENPVAITIDDGYRDAYDIAFPLLGKYKLPATLYVITNFLNREIWLWTDLMRFIFSTTSKTEFESDIGNGKFHVELLDDDSRIDAAALVNSHLKKVSDETKNEAIRQFADDLGVEVPSVPPSGYEAIDWEQAREMDRAGLTIECHTVNHPILTKIPGEELERELSESKKMISRELGRECRHFCYPNGVFDSKIRDAVERAGFESAVSTRYGFCKPGDDRYQLKRIDSQPKIANFAQSVSGFEQIRENIGI